MTSRERVLMALNHQEPDRVPLDLGAAACCFFTKAFYVNLLDYLGLEDPDIHIVDIPTQTVLACDAVLEKLGVDVRLGFAPSIPPKDDISKIWEDEKNFYHTDNWGVQYRMPKKPGYYYDMIGHPMEDTDESEDDKIIWPDYPTILEEPTKMYNASIPARGLFNAFGHCYNLGVYESGPRLFGFEDWLSMLITEPDRVTRYLTKLVDRKIEWWRRVFAVCGDSIDMICEMDDLGTQRAPWMSPELYKKLIFPHHYRLYHAIHDMKPGVKVFHHSCGSIIPMIPMLIEAGVDVLNPVQTNAAGMDPYFLKKEFGKDICFWGGGINTQQVLPRGTEQEIIDNVKWSLDALAPGGGYVFSTIHDVQPDVPPKNFMIMHEAFLKYSGY